MELLLNVKLGARSATVNIELATVAELQSAIRTAFDLGDGDEELKVLCKGKAIKVDAQVGGLESGQKLMVMVSKSAERAAVDSTPRERMRGFEEDDLRLRTGSTGKAATGAAAAFKSRENKSRYRFHELQPLPVLPPGVEPPVAAARQRLRELSEDPAILAIMKRHEFTVLKLSEMPPEGQVGVSAECLMGLNKNAGQEILLRLRTDDGRGLRPYGSVIPVLLHELTHNVHGDHDNDFKALCSQLTREYAQLKEPGYPATRSDAHGAASADDQGRLLGGGSATSMAEARSKAFGFVHAPLQADPAQPEATDVTDGVAGGCACGKCDVLSQCGECEA